MTEEAIRRDSNDGQLAADARAGNRAAFDELYRKHAPLIARRLRRILGRKEDVEDVLQMTFLELHRSLDRYDTARPFGAWLHGISLRVTSTFLRTRRRRWWQTGHSDVESLPPGFAQSPEDSSAVSEEARAIWREVERLAPDKRIAFVLFEIEQNTVAQVAELTGTSPQTAWARINSARQLVTKQLAKRRAP